MFKSITGKISKTKIGTLLVGIGTIISTVGAYLTGDMALMKVIELVLIEIGGILMVLGIRDFPIINKGD